MNGVGEGFGRGKIRPISELSQRSFMSYEVQGPMTWITYGWRKAVEAVETAHRFLEVRPYGNYPIRAMALF